MTALVAGCQGWQPARRGQRRLRLADLPEADRDQVLAELIAGGRDEPLAAAAGDLDTMPGAVGVTYLLHFTDATGAPAAYEHAAHYLGWASDLLIRLAQHRAGVAAGGARLMEVIYAAGLRAVVSRVWPGTTRATEAILKRRGGRARLCPLCDPSAVRRARRPCWAAWEQSRRQTPGRWGW